MNVSAEMLTCLSNRRLHLILLPTEACNFRCVYCYEQFQYNRMEPWVVTAVKSLIRRRATDLDMLSLSWFGGEPTLARSIVEDVMVHAGEMAREHPSLRVVSDMTTNGYLLAPETFSRLVRLGIRSYQISFDGPREAHDRKRVLAGGRGTFDRIWGNMLSMRSSADEFTIMVRVHVDRANVGDIPALLETYRESFGTDPRFELFLRGLSRLGGAHDPDLAVFEGEEGRREVERLRELARVMGLKLVSMEEKPVCYAARANSFVVRANGRLNKCTVALEHPRNQVGRLREDGTVELSRDLMTGWMRGLRSGESEELRCPMKGYADPIPLHVAAT